MTITHGVLKRFLFLLLATAAVLCAQDFRGTLTGTVTDPSGATVAQAQVKAVNNATQQAYTAITNSHGSYYIPYVLPGTYTVTVTMAGFKTQVQDNVVMTASQTRGMNIMLQLGATSQSVEVTAAPPLIETANGSGGTVLTQHELENVPLEWTPSVYVAGNNAGIAVSADAVRGAGLFGNARLGRFQQLHTGRRSAGISAV